MSVINSVFMQGKSVYVDGAQDEFGLKGRNGRARYMAIADQSVVDTPKTYVANVRQQLTIDKVANNTENGIMTDRWDSVDNTFTPVRSGQAFLLRINMTMERLTSGNDEIIVDLDIGAGAFGASPIIIAADTKSATIGTPQQYIYTIPIFTSPLMIANGLKMGCTVVGGDFEMSALGCVFYQL